MTPCIVLLNGPPRVGKDTAANMIRMATNHDVAVIGFAHHLKRMVHGIYFGAKGFAMDPNEFDAIKGEPQALLDGMTWRQAYIHYSENVIKPLHGKEWFGSQFVRAVHDSVASLVVVPDSGFREEAERVVREFGADHCKLVRLHRAGCTYDGDSRSYISLLDLGVPEFDVENVTGDRHIMSGALMRAIGPWM